MSAMFFVVQHHDRVDVLRLAERSRPVWVFSHESRAAAEAEADSLNQSLCEDGYGSEQPSELTRLLEMLS